MSTENQVTTIQPEPNEADQAAFNAFMQKPNAQRDKDYAKLAGADAPDRRREMREAAAVQKDQMRGLAMEQAAQAPHDLGEAATRDVVVEPVAQPTDQEPQPIDEATADQFNQFTRKLDPRRDADYTKLVGQAAPDRSSVMRVASVAQSDRIHGFTMDAAAEASAQIVAAAQAAQAAQAVEPVEQPRENSLTGSR